MNGWDILLILALLAAAAWAVSRVIRNRKRGGGCTGDCSRCGENCSGRADR